jgi:hypothetical protein
VDGEVIPEPVDSGGQAIQRRNNNLLCVAIVLFIIGFFVLEGVMSLYQLWTIFRGQDQPGLIIVAMLFGVPPTLGGIYVMWRWWKSGG